MAERRIIKRIFIAAFISCLSCYANYCVAQQVETSIDRHNILIGEQLKYTIKTSFQTNRYKANWFTLPDSIAHFEVVDRGKIDSTIDNTSTVLQQTITYTSFDSGSWNLPPVVIKLDPLLNDSVLNLLTDSVPVNVGYSPADSTGQLRDIKPIMDVIITDYTWYYVAGGAVLLLLIIYLLWKYFKNKKPAEQIKSSRNAYEDAMTALTKLKQYDLQNKEEVKAYHTELSTIFREYVSRKQNKQLLNSTSGDVLISLSAYNFDSAIISTVATALRTGDAVKFAKYMPAVSESEESFEQIKTTIQLIEQQSKTAQQVSK